MWQSVLIAVIAIVIALYEIPRLKKLGYIKEIWVFSVLLVIATAVNVVKFLNL
jgi:hypothetical protein